ncbi:MAG: hypothetical protein QW743_08345 [Candidatus Methanomethylicia archaeon]
MSINFLIKDLKWFSYNFEVMFDESIVLLKINLRMYEKFKF